MAEVSTGAPSEVPALLAARRLKAVRLQARRDLLSPALRERLGEALQGVSPEDLAVVGLLTTQWDILRDIACFHGNEGDPVEAQLELLVLMALGLKQYPLAQSIHQARLDRIREQPAHPARWALEVEAALAPRGQLPPAQAAAAVGLGLALLDVRALAEIGSLYYAAAAIEEEAVAELHALSAADKAQVIEVLLALAWADGRVAPAERRLIAQQVDLADLDRGTAEALLARLDRPPAGDDDVLAALDATSWDLHARRFVLEQVVLLSLVDDQQSEQEVALIERVAARLGAAPGELDEVLVEVHAFYERNRTIVHEDGPVAGALGRLLVSRTQAAIRGNMRKILQEIRETGELAKLLGAASVRELTPEEGVKVRAQLLDVCKTIPALAIFLLPGGGLLLPVLIRLLPFNILPTAFADAGTSPGEPELLPPAPEA